ncbi:hypothetical protein H0H93_005958, partial [Arthromyces matolae]
TRTRMRLTATRTFVLLGIIYSVMLVRAVPVAIPRSTPALETFVEQTGYVYGDVCTQNYENQSIEIDNERGEENFADVEYEVRPFGDSWGPVPVEWEAGNARHSTWRFAIAEDAFITARDVDEE